MTQNHTSLPWGYDGDGFDSVAAELCDTDGYTIFPIDADGVAIGCIAEIIDMGDDEESEANAKFIVRSVNNHEALLAWVIASPHDGFCSRYNNPKSDHKCGCGRDALIARARGEA